MKYILDTAAHVVVGAVIGFVGLAAIMVLDPNHDVLTVAEHEWDRLNGHEVKEEGR